MQCDPASTDRINSFSLVSYLPGKLGDFVTGLRQELVSGCVAQSHVTILPPRPLLIDPQIAEERIQQRVAGFAPVVVGICELRVFEQSQVVFADLDVGRAELLEMHEALNRDEFAFNEAFPYHPHITLAQGIPPERLKEVFEIASRRWKESPASSFSVDTLTFVQNTAANRWIDLVECELRGEPALR